MGEALCLQSLTNTLLSYLFPSLPAMSFTPASSTRGFPFLREQNQPRLSTCERFLTPAPVKPQIRNQLVHNYDVNAIPGDRGKFIRDFEDTVSELHAILARKGGAVSDSLCTIS